jgi:hypothetical protein
LLLISSWYFIYTGGQQFFLIKGRKIFSLEGRKFFSRETAAVADFVAASMTLDSMYIILTGQGLKSGIYQTSKQH